MYIFIYTHVYIIIYIHMYSIYMCFYMFCHIFYAFFHQKGDSPSPGCQAAVFSSLLWTIAPWEDLNIDSLGDDINSYGWPCKNGGTPKSSILIGFSIIFTIHFGVPLFLETPICLDCFFVDRRVVLSFSHILHLLDGFSLAFRLAGKLVKMIGYFEERDFFKRVGFPNTCSDFCETSSGLGP